MIGLTSGWNHLIFSEDGADEGSFSPLPGTPFRQGNKKEVKAMLKYAISECHARGKKFYFTAFPMDVLHKDPDDDIYKEEFFNQRRIKWSRMEAFPEVMKELGM